MRKTALVTGASSGIGVEFARQLASTGHDLVLVARRVERLEALASELAASGARVEVLPADLTRPEAPAEIEAELAARGLVVDVLVNNAGLGGHGAFATAPWPKDATMIDLNVRALTELTKRFLPGMLERGAGGVLNVASTASFQSMPYFAVYAATKAYVLSFSEALAEEVGPLGVSVTCLCPGPTQTEFVERAEFQSDIIHKAPYMSAAEVASEGLAGLRAGKRVVVPGPLNALQAAAPRFFPRGIYTRIVGAIFKPTQQK